MKRLLGMIAAVLISMTALTAVAKAEGVGVPYYGSASSVPTDQFKWTGLYLGGGLGGGVADGELTGTDFYGGDPKDFLGINGLSGRGYMGDVRAGFDWKVGNSPFLLGVFGGHNWGAAEFDGFVGPEADRLNVSADLEQTWYFGGRAGLIFRNQSLLYGGYAYTQGDLDLSINDGTPLCGERGGNCSHTLDGHMLLAGMEFPLANGFTLAGEYNYIMYDTANVFDDRDGNGGERFEVEPDAHTFKLRLNYRTNLF